ncbi:hypothetical protein AB669_20115 [Pedobacter sp. BMA]|nr:hypothetical protein AB669_20115 [Pedobacter sp. BMA]
MLDVPAATKIRKLIKMIDENPDDAEAHYWYLNTMGKDTTAVEMQYVSWMKIFPKTAMVSFQLGHYYMQLDVAKARQYLGQAIKTNPQLIKGWQDLYLLSYFEGDRDATSILKNALAANPGNAKLAFRYAYTFKLTDPEQYQQSLKKIASKKNTDKYNVKAASLLADISNSYPDKKKLYEEIKESYLSIDPAEIREIWII